MIDIDEILDADKLAAMVAEGMVSARPHPRLSLTIYCYTKKAQSLGAWNSVTKACRGLILDANGQVVARPWAKFFTLQQHESGWHLGDEENEQSDDSEIATLDFDAPADVTDKIDGSLGILYDDDGAPALATKGAFTSDQALRYTKIMRERYLDAATAMLRDTATTFLFELIGPGNRIVLAYPDDDIVFLGAVDIATGQYRPTSDFAGLWPGPVSQPMPAHSLREALALPPRPDKEGMVVRFLDESRQIKIKQQDYLALHRAIFSFSARGLRDWVRQNEITVADIVLRGADHPGLREMIKFPGHERFPAESERRERLVVGGLIEPMRRAITEADKAMATLDGAGVFSLDYKDAKRAVAAWINETRFPHRPLLFKLADARLKGEPLEAASVAAELTNLIDRLRLEREAH